jgi:hypothetical protein
VEFEKRCPYSPGGVFKKHFILATKTLYVSFMRDITKRPQKGNSSFF